jgi:uncharacterized MnhB-related membrane protein
MKSAFLSLNTKDFLKGLVVSVLTSVLTIVYTSLQSGSLTIEWKAVGTAAITAALAYITKNYLTNSEDQIHKKEPKI